MTAKHLDGLSTSVILREAAVVLRTGGAAGTPTAETYAEQLVKRAALLESAAKLEINSRPSSPWAGPVELLRALGEVRR